MPVNRSREDISLGIWTEDRLDGIIREGSTIPGTGERIAFLSEQFLGTPYREHTLIGNENTSEVFVIDLGAMDCFTFLDYVEAMRLSDSFSSFRKHLLHVRYRLGKIAYHSRNHFFTDWSTYNNALVYDATKEIGATEATKIFKRLNEGRDGKPLLPGIPIVEREIAYLPSQSIGNRVLDSLRTGDYGGIYTPAPGLDVSHVGIIIRKGGGLFLRHASSRPASGAVCDEPFTSYIKDKAGIIILRPR